MTTCDRATMLLKFIVNNFYLKKRKQENLTPKIVRQKLDVSGNSPCNTKWWENLPIVYGTKEGIWQKKPRKCYHDEKCCCCRTTNKYIELDSMINSKGWERFHQRTTRIADRSHKISLLLTITLIRHRNIW